MRDIEDVALLRLRARIVGLELNSGKPPKKFGPMLSMPVIMMIARLVIQYCYLGAERNSWRTLPSTDSPSC